MIFNTQMLVFINGDKMYSPIILKFQMQNFEVLPECFTESMDGNQLH